MFPAKTTLAIATLAGLLLLPQIAPALKDYPTVNSDNLRAVLDLPVEKYRPAPVIEIPRLKHSEIARRRICSTPNTSWIISIRHCSRAAPYASSTTAIRRPLAT
jgi:hypothetical protein